MRQLITEITRKVVDARIRDGLWALRSRGDRTVIESVIRGALNLPYKIGSNQDHLKATMEWLCAAQDATTDGGISAFYDVRSGVWGPPYPETTGYIIPTFFDYAVFNGDKDYRTRAFRMANWLLTTQLKNGAFPIGPLWPDWERVPLIFDTGQIIHGLVRAYEEDGSLDYLEAARRAGDFLLEVQDEDGGWSRFTPLNHVNTYNTRTAWALLRLHEATHDQRYQAAAVQNLTRVITQQMHDGWFCNAAFRPDEDPLTHTIVYTIEGLLESGKLLSDHQFIEAASLASTAMLERQKQDGYLRARYGQGWQPTVNWSCLTGNAQMAMVWLQLFEITGDNSYVQAAIQANRFIKQTQCRNSRLDGVRGGISGSYPIYGEYEPYRHLNWAAKFFVDSLLLEESIPNGQKIQSNSMQRQENR